MACTTIEYKSQVVRTTDTQLRFVPLAPNSRIPTKYTITLGAAAAINAETLTVTALPVKLWPGDELVFTGGLKAKVAAEANLAATSVKVTPLVAAMATGLTAQTIGSVYVAGVTEASPNSTPKTEDTTNYLSGTAKEMAIVGSDYQLSMTVNRVEGCPGQKLLLDILYDEAYLSREIFAIYKRPNGETYEGAAIPTTGTQSGAVQAMATMQVNLQYQGCSMKYTKADNAAVIAWPV